MSNPSKKQRLADSAASPDPSKPLPLQRRRVWRACESCRRKKVKCDGNEPTCGQCMASKSTCNWIQTKDRAALSRHYVQELEARLLHMESLLTKVVEQSHRREDDAPESSNIPPQSSSSAQRNMPTASFNGHKALEAETLAGVKLEDLEPSLSDQLGQLALDDHGHLRWIGSSSTMSIIQAFRELTAEPEDRYSPPVDLGFGSMGNMLYFPPGLGFGKVRALPGPEEVEYPARDLADKLVSTYFEHLHFQLPVVHKPTFLAQYESLMDCPIKERRDTGLVSVLFAIFACAARIVDDDRLVLQGSENDGGMGLMFYERAMVLYYIGQSKTQLAQVQSFVLLASFLCSVNCLPQAWLVIGQAVRIAQDLGLHRSPKHLPIYPADKEVRRKTWWSVYTMDRMLSLALGRPLGVDDRDCDTELPLQVDDDQLQTYFEGRLGPQLNPSLMSGFVALSSLFKLGGEVMRSIYSQNNAISTRADLQGVIDNLDAQLTSWCEQLPPAFKSLPANELQARIACSLASSYYAILITLHRKSLSPGRLARIPLGPASNSVPKAVMAARSCLRLVPSAKLVISASHHLALFIQFLSTSAIIILLFAMYAPDEESAEIATAEIETCLQALEAWEGSWPGARKNKELLQELLVVARNFRRQGIDRGTLSSPSSTAGHSTLPSYGGKASPNSPSLRKSPISTYQEHSPSTKPAGLKRGRGSEFEESNGRVSQMLPGTQMYSFQDPGSSSTSFYPGHSENPPAGDLSTPIWALPPAFNDPQFSRYPNAAVDPRALSFNNASSSAGAGDHGQGPGSAGSTPPLLPPFDSSHFPFAGLDFLHNFTPAGFGGSEGQKSMEAMWANLGAGAFNMDPDLQFTLTEGPVESPRTETEGAGR